MGNRLYYDGDSCRRRLLERVPPYWGGAYVNDAAHDPIGRLVCPVSLVCPVWLPCCRLPR